MPHTFMASIVGSRKSNLYTPSAMDGYFDELAEGLRAGIDEPGLDQISRRYAIDVLGPAPEGYL